MSNMLGYESQCVAPSLISHVPETYGHQAAIYLFLHMCIGFSMYQFWRESDKTFVPTFVLRVNRD